MSAMAEGMAWAMYVKANGGVDDWDKLPDVPTPRNQCYLGKEDYRADARAALIHMREHPDPSILAIIAGIPFVFKKVPEKNGADVVRDIWRAMIDEGLK